jgi:hypothetical protein
MKCTPATTAVRGSFVVVPHPGWIPWDPADAASHLLRGRSSWASFHGTWNPLRVTVLLWASDPVDLVYSDTTVHRDSTLASVLPNALDMCKI